MFTMTRALLGRVAAKGYAVRLGHGAGWIEAGAVKTADPPERWLVRCEGENLANIHVVAVELAQLVGLDPRDGEERF